MQPSRFAAVAALFVLIAVPGRVSAQDTTRRGVTVGITYDPSSKPGLVVLPVQGANADSVRTIVQRDLDYGDLFTVVTLDATNPATFRIAGGALNYPLFAKLGAVAIVQMTVTPRGLHVALHDVAKRGVASVEDFALPGAPLGRDWRMAVHGASDQIEQWITGRPGIARTRVAFVRGNGLRLVDSDGWGEVPLPVVGQVLSPTWSPSARVLAYATFGVDSRIAVLDLGSGRTRVLAATPNFTNLTPTFSPDGRSIVYSHADENGSDLYHVAADGSGARRITVGRGSDNAQPTFSPDGRRIAFTSGRAGHPEIYIMDADGTNPELLTSFDFGDQNYRSDPDWSPDGRAVAFQSQFSGRFQIMTINLSDRGTKLLTSEGANEQPSWAPDGRHLVFTSTRGGARDLWVIDTESGRMRQLTHAAGSRLAAWSPRLGGGAP